MVARQGSGVILTAVSGVRLGDEYFWSKAKKVASKVVLCDSVSRL